MTEHAPQTTSALAGDVYCIGCGYNLRGLSREGVCPECGESVERSVLNDELRFREPGWIWRLWLGSVLLNSAVGGAVVLSIARYVLRKGVGSGVGGLVEAFRAVQDPNVSWWRRFLIDWAYSISRPMRLLDAGGFACIFLLGVAGVWLMTPRDRSEPKESGYGLHARLARWLITTGALGMAGTLFAQAWWGHQHDAVLWLSRFVFFVVLLGGVAALLSWCRRLAEQTQTVDLAKQCAEGGRGMGISAALLVVACVSEGLVIFIQFILGQNLLVVPLFAVAVLATVSGAVGALFFIVWTLVLFVRIPLVLCGQWREAEALTQR